VAALGAAACNSCDRAPPPEKRKAAEPQVPQGMRATAEADVALQKGELDDAIKKAEAASKADPTNPVAANVLGRAASERFLQTHDDADAERAKAAFIQALKADRNFWPALQNLGELEERRGRLPEAAAYFEKVLEAQPEHPEKERYRHLIETMRGGPLP
jgi:tetratricopeptide (TPR) repeat protein